MADLAVDDLERLVDRSVAYAEGLATRPLANRSVGVLFWHTSTRTRTSFHVGAARLGATVVAYGPNDLQLNTGESWRDTGRVLGQFLDALVVRKADTDGHLDALSQQSDMAIVNAMARREHPTQALADLTTLKRRFGRLTDLHVLYVGEGNNTACALALAVAKLPGLRLTLLTPPGYGLPEDVRRGASEAARRGGSAIEERHDMAEVPRGVHAVYTTRWQTTGTQKPDPDWRERFEPFRVTSALMERVGSGETILMHDLPAHVGEEVTTSALEGPTSVVLQQAKNKMFSAMAVLEWCCCGLPAEAISS